MTREEHVREAAYSRYCNSSSVTFGLQCNSFHDGAKWADSTMVEKVVEWLSLNAEFYGGFNGGKLNEMVCELKKAMEE